LRADGDNRRSVEKGASAQGSHLLASKANSFSIGKVGLRERDNAIAKTQKAANIEVLARLRLYRIVSGNHQQNSLNARCTREHVFNEALMAGNIDETDSSPIR
jgi:hypothetical protein